MYGLSRFNPYFNGYSTLTLKDFNAPNTDNGVSILILMDTLL